MSSPRIAVTMSCFNEAPHLRETIPAVLEQHLSDFRLLILDNGSTDESTAILRAYERYDARVTVLRADRNLMPGKVANLLARVAMDLWSDCGWFVAAGADDVMAPDYLAAILSAADENPSANLIFSPWEYIGGVPAPKHFPPFNPETCHAEHQIPAWSAVRRDLWETAGGHNEQMIAADWDWVVRGRHLIKPVQLSRPYIALRVREGARVTQSAEVHWPSLHRHLCELSGKPTPQWAMNASAVC